MSKSKKLLNKKKVVKITVVFLILIVALLTWQGIRQRNTNQTNISASVTSLEKINEVAFLNVGVQKVVTSKETTKIFSKDIPFSEKTSIIILNYNAKFGIKEHVTIKQLSDSHYNVIVPKFEVIGFELAKDNSYQLYDSQKGILSYSTKDIDTGKLVTDSLSDEEQQAYLKEYSEMIKESARSYYKQIFTSIDKDAKVTVKFQD